MLKKIFLSIFLIFNFLICFSQGERVKLLSEYIQIKSVSGNEKPAAEFMLEKCKSMGFVTEVFHNLDSSFNFCASLYKLDKNLPNILLINHLDVVPAEDKGDWKFGPYSGKIDNDTIYGRGSIDMKGLAVMQLYAMKQLMDSVKQVAPYYNVTILFLSGEETGGLNGASKIVKSSILSRLNPKVVLGEGGGGLTGVIPGAENKLCFFVSVAEKRSIWLRLDCKIKAHGHGSVPSKKNANRILLKSIEKIDASSEKIKFDPTSRRAFRELGNVIGGYKGFVLKNMHWWIMTPIRNKVLNDNEILKTLVTNSFQLTQIQNPPGAVNQVAQTASAFYDCRLLPNKSEKPLMLKLLFRIVDPRIKITVLDESPEANATRPDKHYDNLKASILENFPNATVIPVLFPATTDNSYFRSNDIPTYGLLPFQLSAEMMETVHASNERLPINAIDQGVRIYYNFLKRYF